MKQVKDFGSEQNIWEMGSWNGEGITKLWSKNWHRLDPCIHTEINIDKMGCMEKSQKGQISWKTCKNNMKKKKSFEGNRILQRRSFQSLKNDNTLPLHVFVKYCWEIFTN